MKEPPRTKLAVLPPSLLKRSFPITMPDGRVWRGHLYGTVHRKDGGRIQVRDLAGFGLYDTLDHVDDANAYNALDNWLAQFLPQGHLPDIEQAVIDAIAR